MEGSISKDMVGGFVRHGITVFAGGLVTAGYVDDSGLQMIAGGMAALVGVAWSFWQKRRARQG